jgi:hypothetical protein
MTAARHRPTGADRPGSADRPGPADRRAVGEVTG